jgi:ribonuclease HII
MKQGHPPYKDFFEKAAWRRQKLLCGIDEVGRGCLAGPVVVAATILPINTDYTLNDSKKMSAAQRDKAFAWLQEKAAYSVAFGSAHLVDERNIYQATKVVMRRTCLQLAAQHPALFGQLEGIVIDAMPLALPLPDAPPLISFNHGEHYSRSIAAASIIAKVTRDRLIANADELFPRFAFAQNKAYGTAHHRMTLQSHHATLLHRKSFITKILPTQAPDEHAPLQRLNEQHTQQRLC